MRTPLNDRRQNITTEVKWTTPSSIDQKLIVTYGLDRGGKVREAFCAGYRADTDLCALTNDACIMMSLLLQHGVSITEVAAACGQNTAEGETDGPPASLLGAIAREGVNIERLWNSGQIGLMK